MALKSLHKVSEELTASTDLDLLLRANRIVIPQALAQTIIDIAHEGHQGMTKTKQLLREKVWFPNMDTLVDNTVRDCLLCQLTTPNDTRTSLTMSTLPDSPWLEVSIDFCDLPTGEHLVVMDDYSRFPKIEIITSTSARSVIPKLDHIFATFGIPKVVRSDTGPPFNST